ncbi:hypothetical protein HDV03_002861 [Kappamyces sp. JEL0829]|nr:hypothetical protein HDV03_002861 [Kappamyces sp. JEL0829]
MVTIPDQCCISSLDTSINGTLGVTSGTDILLPSSAPDEASILHYAPATANGASYCYLTALDSSSLFTYQNILYLNDGFCVDPYYSPARCFPNGTLAFYPGTSGCEGTPETFDLSSLSQELTSDYAGSFLAKIVTVGTGKTTIGWTRFAPATLLVPNFKNASEVFEIIFFILALIGMIYSCYFALRKFLKTPKPEPALLLFSQLVWVGWIILRIYYIYAIFVDFFKLSQFSTALSWLFNIASGSTVAYTTVIFFRVLTPPRTTMIAISVGMFVAHFFFAGGNYAKVWEVMDGGNYMPTDGFLHWQDDNWSKLGAYWVIIMFVWDIVPLSLVVFKVVNQASGVPFNAVLAKIWHIDRWYIFAVLGQLGVVFLYYLCSILNTYTSVPQNDRVALAISAYQAFFLAVHSLLNCYMVVRLKVVMKNVKKGVFTTTNTSTQHLKSSRSVLPLETNKSARQLPGST